MPKYPIKLGKKMPGIPSGVLAVAGSPENPAGDEMFYPSLQLEWEDDYELPDTGTLTIRYKTASETNDKGGQRVSLDVTEIVSASADKEDEEEESTGERLDKEMKKAMKKEMKKEKRKKSPPADPEVEVEEESVEMVEGMGY